MFALPLLAGLSACSSLERPSCPGGQQPSVQDLLYFGTDMPEGSVSANDWARFRDETFTVGFPEGFTVWEASGQWRSALGKVIQEQSYVLNLVHPASVEAEQSIQEYIAAYKVRFRQEAVLRVTSVACISF